MNPEEPHDTLERYRKALAEIAELPTSITRFGDHPRGKNAFLLGAQHAATIARAALDTKESDAEHH